MHGGGEQKREGDEIFNIVKQRRREPYVARRPGVPAEADGSVWIRYADAVILAIGQSAVRGPSVSQR